jgi:hypothetical protein
MERWLHTHPRHGFHWQVNPWTGDPSVAVPDIAFLTGDSMVGGTVCRLAYPEFTRRLELLPYWIEETHP